MAFIYISIIIIVIENRYQSITTQIFTINWSSIGNINWLIDIDWYWLISIIVINYWFHWLDTLGFHILHFIIGDSPGSFLNLSSLENHLYILLNPLTSGAPSCARKKNCPENPVRPYAPCHKWLILIGCRLDTKSLGYLKYAETWHA